MKARIIALATICLMPCASLHAGTGPFDGKNFKGRLALSHDGNFNDEDDWGAFPVAIAIADAFGVKDKLVHIDFNNIIQANDERFEREMTASVLGAAEKYGIAPPILHNCRTDLEGAIKSLTAAVNASSRDNPLYYLVAGPMDVPYRGILAADPAKRRYVYCLSHSSWNDGYGTRRIEGRNKRDLIGLGINWVQVKPGHLLAYTGKPATKSTPKEWALFQWMHDSSDERLKWIYTRLQAEERCDVSDATIIYSLLSGDEECNPGKLAALLDKKQKPKLIAERAVIRLEAENFVVLENYAPFTVGRQASQNVTVRLSDTGKGRIRTGLHEPNAALSGRYEIGVRYRDENKGAATFALRINGVQHGESWKASANDNSWKTQTIQEVPLVQGDAIEIAAQGDGGERGELDYVELTHRRLDSPAAGR